MAELEVLKNKFKGRRYVCRHKTSEVVARCPISGLPDFYTVTITYEPDEYMVELKSLKLYYVSLMNEKLFHEDLINTVLEAFVEAVRPKWVHIRVEVNVRGGITTVLSRYWSSEKGDVLERAVVGLMEAAVDESSSFST